MKLLKRPTALGKSVSFHQARILAIKLYEKQSKYLNGFLKRESFLYILLWHISTRLLFRMGTCLEMHVEDTLTCIHILHLIMRHILLYSTGRGRWDQLSDRVVVQLTYSSTLGEISLEKWQVSAKVHTSHTYVMTHNAELCIMAEKFRPLFIFFDVIRDLWYF